MCVVQSIACSCLTFDTCKIARLATGNRSVGAGEISPEQATSSLHNELLVCKAGACMACHQAGACPYLQMHKLEEARGNTDRRERLGSLEHELCRRQGKQRQEATA